MLFCKLLTLSSFFFLSKLFIASDTFDNTNLSIDENRGSLKEIALHDNNNNNNDEYSIKEPSLSPSSLSIKGKNEKEVDIHLSIKASLSSSTLTSESKREKEKKIEKKERRGKSDESDRLHVIDSVLEGIYKELSVEFFQVFPKDVVGIIESYEYISKSSHEHICKRIFIELNVSKEEETSLSFDGRDFFPKFHEILQKRRKSILHNYVLRHDLSRIIFKWIVWMKRILKDDFNELKKEIKFIYDSLKTSNLCLPQLPNFNSLDFDQQQHDYGSSWGEDIRGFLLAEIFDRDDEVFFLYQDALDDFYHRTGNCKLILEKYFGGNFDNDPILKLIICTFDVRGEMKKCFQNIDHGITPLTEKKTEEQKQEQASHYHQVELLKIELIKNFGHGHGCINEDILGFYEKNKYRLRIDGYVDFYKSLKNLQKINMLTRKNVENLFGFPDQWSMELFEKFLINGKAICSNTFGKCMKLFELSR